MENIREIIDDELQRIDPDKLPTALIALNNEGYEQFVRTYSYYWDETPAASVTIADGHPVYNGHPIIRMSALLEPYMIFTEASMGRGVTEYLARD